MLDTISSIIRKAEEENKGFWEIVLEDDMEKKEYSREDSFEKMLTIKGAVINKSPPERIISTISKNRAIFDISVSRFLSLAPYAPPARVAAAVCIP